MAASTAGALELGEINIQSALGQPLRASVAYALQPTEQLGNYCISVAPTMGSGGIPSINSANISVADGVISLTGRSIINEPMASLRLDINCPYTPHLVREFLVFLDPASIQFEAETVPAKAKPLRPAAATADTVSATTRRQVASTERAARIPTPAAPIDSGQRYRVQPGDTVSEIAQRIDNRAVSLWTAVNEIFTANPGAFINDDPNLLKAGTWITIPASASGTASVSETAKVVSTDVAMPTPAAGGSAALADPAEAIAESDERTANAAGLEPTTPAIDEFAAVPFETPVPATQGDTSESLETGDFVIDTDTSSEPATAAPAGIGETSTSWGWWFGGGILALVGGLFLFGRRRTTPPRTDSVEQRANKPKRYLSESPAVEVVETRVPSRDTSVNDYQLDDDSPTEENLILHADAEQDLDLDNGVDVDLSTGYSFASATALDLELPAETAGVQSDEEWSVGASDDSIGQDITVEQETVFDKPGVDEDDDYDMSVIVDATQAVDDSELTSRDLQAIVVDDDEPLDGAGNDGYTISQEVDYDIVVQEYEDELSATQALNAEIERASAELAAIVGENDAAANSEEEAEQETAHLASVTPIDATASLTRDESATVLQFDDETAEMPLAGDDDITTEMPIRSKGS